MNKTEAPTLADAQEMLAQEQLRMLKALDHPSLSADAMQKRWAAEPTAHVKKCLGCGATPQPDGTLLCGH